MLKHTSQYSDQPLKSDEKSDVAWKRPELIVFPQEETEAKSKQTAEALGLFAPSN